MCNATIDAEVTTKPLHCAKWLQGYFSTLPRLQAQNPTRKQTLACIAMLETSSLDLPLSTFRNVFALSAADSLYVAASFLSGPGFTISQHEVRHVIGNIGKPGLSLLIAPPEPQVLQPSANSLDLINRETYDGTQRDSFSETSLHLRFSDWATPIGVGETGQGRRDIDASLVEAYIQVNSAGKWIADLDILTSFRKGCSQFDHDYYYSPSCRHGRISDECRKELEDDSSLTSIDSWDEFLERPDGPAVFRAKKNWLARIAAAVIGVQRHDRVLVGDEVCWVCYEELREAGSEVINKILLLIDSGNLMIWI